MADDRSKSGTLALVAIAAVSAVLIAVDPMLKKDGAFEIEATFGFYALTAVAASLAVWLGGWVLATLVGQEDDPDA